MRRLTTHSFFFLFFFFKIYSRCENKIAGAHYAVRGRVGESATPKIL